MNEQASVPMLPESGYLRLSQIIGPSTDHSGLPFDLVGRDQVRATAYLASGCSAIVYP